MKNLTSLTCSKINYLYMNELFFIADCFPILEELNFSFPTIYPTYNIVVNNDHQLILPLPKLRKINLSGDEKTCKLLISIWENVYKLQSWRWQKPWRSDYTLTKRVGRVTKTSDFFWFRAFFVYLQISETKMIVLCNF
jgi:hypothetical protein